MTTPRAARKAPPAALPRGFTLMELLVALVIVALLAMVAYPGYASHARRAYRATAAACLQSLAHQMERRYTTDMAYDAASEVPAAGCVRELENRYSFAFAASQPTATTYVLQADPQNQQSADTGCGSLRLDQAGQRTVSGDSDVQSCWR